MLWLANSFIKLKQFLHDTYYFIHEAYVKMSDTKRWKTKEYWLGIIHRMHIYKTFNESLIKTLLFLIAFLVSILPLFLGDFVALGSNANSGMIQSNMVGAAEFPENQPQENMLIGTNTDTPQADANTAIGGALIVYGISLIAEICMLLDPNDYLSKKLLTGSILLIGVIMTVFGFAQIFTPQLSASPVVITVFGCFSILIYVFDTIAFYLAKPPNRTSSTGQEAKLKNIQVGV